MQEDFGPKAGGLRTGSIELFCIESDLEGIFQTFKKHGIKLLFTAYLVKVPEPEVDKRLGVMLKLLGTEVNNRIHIIIKGKVETVLVVTVQGDVYLSYGRMKKCLKRCLFQIITACG